MNDVYIDCKVALLENVLHLQKKKFYDIVSVINLWAGLFPTR